MADDKPKTPNERQRRRRPAPTIDLSATEVNAEPPPQTTETETPPPRMDAPARDKRPMLIAAVAGALGGAAIVLGGLWLGGVLPPSKLTGDLTARIAALETHAKAAPKANDSQAIAELGARIGKLEQAPKAATAATDPVLSERLTAVESAMKALGVTLAALNRRAEDSAAAVSAARDRADAAAKATEALEAKLDGIEQSAKATQDKVAQNTGSDMAARRAVAAGLLLDTLARGTPYATELALAKQLGADAQTVAALEPLAASGVPTDAALTRDLNALLPSMVAAAGADASKADGFFERLQANASKLVRVRPVDAPKGDDVSAVLARIEVKAAHNDLVGIDSELDKLPPKIRALADGWRKTLAARTAAIAASRKLAADSAAALGSP
jgi:hypothetical protein